MLCDVSGSVASFARFTLMLVFALREQFQQVRAFTFVDQVHEVTRLFVPAPTRARCWPTSRRARSTPPAGAARTTAAPLRTSQQSFPHAIGPKSSLLVLGDARSNYSDLALPVVRDLAGKARHAHWLNPERRRHWDTGDSAARRTARSCRWWSAATWPSSARSCTTWSEDDSAVAVALGVVAALAGAGAAAHVAVPAELSPALGIGLASASVDNPAAGGATGASAGRVAGRLRTRAALRSNLASRIARRLSILLIVGSRLDPTGRRRQPGRTRYCRSCGSSCAVPWR